MKLESLVCQNGIVHAWEHQGLKIRLGCATHLKDGSVKLSLRNETGEGPGDSEYDDFESFVNLRLLWGTSNEGCSQHLKS